jgi:hypothetical protein
MDDSLEVRRERAARNQLLFRSVNARIEELGEKVLTSAHEVDFACECADTECTEMIALTLPEFQAIKRIKNQFIVRAGHNLPEVEDVLATRDGYAIVTKRGAGAEYVHAERASTE